MLHQPRDIDEPPNGSTVRVWVEAEPDEVPAPNVAGEPGDHLDFTRDDDASTDGTPSDVFSAPDVESATWRSEDFADRGVSWEGLAHIEGFRGVELLDAAPDDEDEDEEAYRAVDHPVYGPGRVYASEPGVTYYENPITGEYDVEIWD